MTKINGIGFNSNININNVGIKTDKADQNEETSKELQSPELNQKPAADVLSFMANSADISNIQKSTKSSKTIEVSKYVTPEQAKRIAGFVNQFETAVGNGLQAMEKEFGNLPAFKNMSDSAKQEVATAAFANANL
jgi:hypothetical protein